MSKELAKKPAAPLAVYEDVSFVRFGAVEVQPEDLRVPRIRILQGMSEAVKSGYAPPGVFFHLGLNRSLGNAGQFIPLGFFVNRVYLDKGEVVCRSQDRVHGEPGGKDSTGAHTTECARCVYSKWHGRTTPPECDLVYNIPVLWTSRDSTEPQVAYLSFRRTASDTAKQLIGDHEADGQPWFGFIYEAGIAEKHNTEGQSWFVMKARRMRSTTPEEQELAYQEAVRLVQAQESAFAIDADEKGEVPY